MLSPIVLWAVGRRLWPIARRDGYVTYTDFIGDFYRSEPLRVIVSVLVVVLFAPYFAVNLVAPGLILETLTDGAIPYSVGVLGMAVVGTAYVLLGGMRGVIWTDILQAAVMYVMFLVLVGVAVTAAGGLGEIVVSLPRESYNYDYDLETWLLVISWMVMITLMQPANPDRAFRLLTAKSMSSIRTGAIASVVLLGMWSVIALSLGWSFNILVPGVEPSDQVMAHGIAGYAVWLMPLFLVTVWAGGMSSMDSGLIACSAMLTKDVYRRHVNRRAPQRRVTLVSRILVVLLGLFATVVALAEPPFLWYFIGAAAAVAMQWLPAVLFALYWRRANTAAAWTAILSGIGTTAVFQYIVESPWPGPAGPGILGLLVQIPLYVAVALLTEPMDREHLARYQGVFVGAAKTETPSR